jgi:hypothetical protein
VPAEAEPDTPEPEHSETTVVRRRTGGLLGAARPAGEQAARAASAATQRLRDIARRARDRGD